MPQEPEILEAEVVEIDGVAPAPTARPEPQARAGGSWQDWQQWQGRVRKLDARWWPLWIVLGIIVVMLLLTVGVLFAAVMLTGRLIFGTLRAIGSLFSPRGGSLSTR